jgi:hypothetical protein
LWFANAQVVELYKRLGYREDGVDSVKAVALQPLHLKPIPEQQQQQQQQSQPLPQPQPQSQQQNQQQLASVGSRR